jgi:hypothetical protein
VKLHRFAARTRLPAEWLLDAATVDAQLDSCRRRWNQFGVETVIEVADDAHGVAVRYRLIVSEHPDPPAVHAAFRGDLGDTLGPPSRTAPPPDDWDLEAMARAAAAAVEPPTRELVYVDERV